MSHYDEFLCPTATDMTCDTDRCPLQGPSIAPIKEQELTGWSYLAKKMDFLVVYNRQLGTRVSQPNMFFLKINRHNPFLLFLAGVGWKDPKSIFVLDKFLGVHMTLNGTYLNWRRRAWRWRWRTLKPRGVLAGGLQSELKLAMWSWRQNCNSVMFLR